MTTTGSMFRSSTAITRRSMTAASLRNPAFTSSGWASCTPSRPRTSAACGAMPGTSRSTSRLDVRDAGRSGARFSFVAAALPLIGLISLLLRRQLDPHLENYRLHFVLFGFVGGLAFILGYAAGE